jgi:hypothetical protein
MKWISFLLMLSILFAGCREKQVTDNRQTSAVNFKKVTHFETDSQKNSNFKPERTDFLAIKTRADLTDNLGEFVTWLKTRTNVSNVVHTELMHLTSNPPKQVVSFNLDGVSHRLVFTKDTDNEFKLL